MGELTWLRATVLAVAVGFLGFSIALFLERDRPADPASVDVGFYQDMIFHHEQALEMSLLETAHGAKHTVRDFAGEVLTHQSWEIGVMERSLAEWGTSSQDRPDEAMGWMDMPVPVEEMPGLLSPDEMDELGRAEGEEADALFLEMMAEHHLGGIHMAEYAARNAESDDVRELAARMARTQAKEINMFAITADRLGLPVDIELVPVPDLGES